jgi:hypothetical protein
MTLGIGVHLESILSTLAFALLIGGQFLAAIFVSSKRESIYGRLENPNWAKHPPAERIPSVAVARELPTTAA